MEISYIKAIDGHQIRMAYFAPQNQMPKAIIQFVHGFGEGLEHFELLADFLTEKGFAFVIHDQRGFGKEALEKGVHGDYQNFLDDIDSVRDWVETHCPQVPVILQGFSMGGNIASNYILARGERRYAALVLESPWLRLYKEPVRAIVGVAEFLGKLNRHWRISSGLNVQSISRDKGQLNTVLHDGIYHDTISFRLFAQVHEKGEFALRNAINIKLPTLLLAAEDDRIVSVKAMRQFAARAGKNLQYAEFPDAFHNLHYDLDNHRMRERLVTFLNEIVENH